MARRTRTAQWGPVALAALIALAAMAGCETKDQPKGQGGKKKIAGIVFQEDQYMRLVLFGMREAAAKAGVELLEGNSNSRPEKEIELINTYVARGVDAICVAPISKKGSVTALKLAQAQGIAIIAQSTPVEGDIAATHIECDAGDLGVQTGKAARRYIQEKLGGKAKVAVIAFKSQVPEQSDARVNGFKSQLADLPGVEYVAEQDAWLPELGVKRVGDILTAHPQINLIWSANEGGTIGAVLAVKNAGKAGDIAVFGTDSSEQLIGFLLSTDNVLQAVTSQRPVDVGRMAVESALKVLRGETVQKKVLLKGILLSRDDPEGVRAFEKQFKEWTTKGAP
ncbi:MAG: substrate-binding domain-containing protein [Planctomycetota bacterium]|nr:substrate-binding domain-containing protein [Planctomycetota bacterium]